MKRIAFATALLLACSSLFAAGPKTPPPFSLPVTYNFYNITYPNNAANWVLGINNSGYMVGYDGSMLSVKGFTLVPTLSCLPPCVFKPENYPGAISTGVAGINNDNVPNFETAGWWYDKTRNSHGFMHNAGAWWDVDYPGTANNFIYGLNDNDVAAGGYLDGVFHYHPYIYSQRVNQFIPLSVLGSDNAWAAGINNNNEIVGTYRDSSGVSHGYYGYAPSSFTALNYPGSSDTYATGINNLGAIVGYFEDASGWHGFIYYGGAWEQIDDPDATDGTYPWGVDDFFLISGWVEGSTTFFGFEAIPQ